YNCECGMHSNKASRFQYHRQMSHGLNLRDSTTKKNKKRKTRPNKVTSRNDTELTDKDNKRRIQVLALECTERDCPEVMPRRKALHDHLKSDRRINDLYPCLLKGCVKRFKNK